MLTSPPAGFALSDFFNDVYTFQRWEIFPGIKTAGTKDVIETLDRLGVPKDLSGKRVLDIGPWNGFFSFECARRGASEVISLGPDDPDRTGYEKTRQLLQLNNCTYHRASVYDLNSTAHGRFDIILFLGVLYHLRYPLLALDRIYDVAQGHLYVECHVIDFKVFDQLISADIAQRILAEGSVFHNLPISYFSKGTETGDAYNWFLPNRLAFADFVESAGFRIIYAGDDGGDLAWLSSIKGERQFAVGLEGYNPGTANLAYFPRNN